MDVKLTIFFITRKTLLKRRKEMKGKENKKQENGGGVEN
jgi:hypothetical protein